MIYSIMCELLVKPLSNDIYDQIVVTGVYGLACITCWLLAGRVSHGTRIASLIWLVTATHHLYQYYVEAQRSLMYRLVRSTVPNLNVWVLNGWWDILNGNIGDWRPVWALSHPTPYWLLGATIATITWLSVTSHPYCMTLLAALGRTKYRRGAAIRNRLRTGQGIPEIQPYTANNHTHGTSAGERTTSLAWMRAAAESLGLTPVSLEMSKTEQRRGHLGERHLRWPKDYAADPCLDDGNAQLIVDCDYYMDMPKVLRMFKPTLIYTMMPTQASNANGEVTWTWTEDNELDVHISGTGHYTHPVWNYNQDTVDVIYYGHWSIAWALKALNMPIHRTIYNVDLKPISTHHRIVCLTPICRLYHIGAWASLAPVLGRFTTPLKRFEPVKDGKVSYRVMSPSGMTRTSCLAGEMSCATLPENQHSVCEILHTNSKNGITPYHVSRVTGHTGDSERDETSQVVTAVITTPPAGVVADPQMVNTKNFTIIKDVNQKAPVPSMHQFMLPLYDAAHSPTRCKANDLACVEGRVTSVKSDKKMTAKIRKFALEFIEEYFRPWKGDLLLFDVDALYKKQTRPTQRNILDDAMMGLNERNDIRSFQKAEKYGKWTHPRNISPVDARTKVVASRFQYAIAVIMKEALRGYTSGMDPPTIARRVARICANSNVVALGDLSRQDGHISPAARELEEMLLRYLVADGDQYLVDEYLERYAEFGRTAFSVKYEIGTARTSGHPETSNFNSLLTRFILWLAQRFDGLSTLDIRARLTAFLGDDSILGDVTSKSLMGAASAVGQVMTVDFVERGHQGVEFLARKFGPGVWAGDPSSTCDILRTLAGIHVTPRCPDAPEVKLLEKARSLILSDHNTPGLGPFLRRVVELAADEDPTIHTQTETFRNVAISDNLRNHRHFHTRDLKPGSGWPNDNVEWAAATHERLGINWSPLLDWLPLAVRLEDMLRPPMVAHCDAPARFTEPVRLGDQQVAADDKGKREECPEPDSTPPSPRPPGKPKPKKGKPKGKRTPAGKGSKNPGRGRGGKGKSSKAGGSTPVKNN